MYRKVCYIIGAAAGSFAVTYGFRNHYLKDGYGEVQIIKAVSAQDKWKETERNGSSIFPLYPSAIRTGYEKQNLSINHAIMKARDLAYRMKDEVGAPGLVIGVSVNGETVWSEGK
jgi:hypothetical protein